MLAELLKLDPAKHGFLTREVAVNDQRTGFEIISSGGEKVALASVESKSPLRVGSYGVELADFEGFLDTFPPPPAGALLYVDEIGQMQLSSHLFEAFIRQALDSKADFLGTITSVYENDFTREVKSRPDVIIVEITPQNREEVKGALVPLVARLGVVRSLPAQTQDTITLMARFYARQGDLMRLRKLFKNAVKYLAEEKVVAHGRNSFTVEGDHGVYRVIREGDLWGCECDLFLGQGQYEGRGGECSHIQAAQLLGANTR